VQRRGHGNECELIPMVKMETRHPVESSFGSEFLSIYNDCGVMVASSCKTWKKVPNFCGVFFGKMTLYGKIF